MLTRARTDIALLGLLGYIALLLYGDARLASLRGQYALAAVTWSLFFVASRAFGPRERRDAWLCIVFSTLVEYACTQAWGLYHYRLGNVPMNVPPGHGVVFLFGLAFAQRPWVLRSARKITTATLIVATAWCIAGLTVLARKTGHVDVHGALYWPFFVYYLRTRSNAPVFVATFVITTWIELLGVHWQTWHWATTVPGLGISSADPPSLIAGGYCAFAEVAHALGRQWDAARASRTARTVAAAASR